MVGKVRINRGEQEMKFLKKYLKLFIGIAVLILFVVVFFFAMKSSDLENGNLKQWRAADVTRRMTAAQILSASDSDLDLLVKCVDKISEIPDSGDMAVRDAVALCYTGIQVNQNN